MITEFHEEDTRVVVEVDGVRGVLTYVGHTNCEGCTLEGICASVFSSCPCCAFSGNGNYMFVQESRLKKGGKI